MTDERDTPAGKRRASRKRPESEVDREGLARVVSGRLAELFLEGDNQEKVAQRVGCSPSTLRNMKNGTGDSHYGHELLTLVAGEGLGLPDDQLLVKTFYRPVVRDPTLPSDAEVVAQEVMSQLESRLAKINAIPELQERLKAVADDVHEVRSQLEILLELDHTRPRPDSQVGRTAPASISRDPGTWENNP